MKSPVLEIIKVSKSYGTGPTSVAAVKEVSLEIDAGQIILVMGPSGSGKTTLLLLLGALLRPTEGSIRLNGVEVGELSERRLPAIRLQQIGFIFQDFNLLSALNVLENVALVARLAGLKKEAARTKAQAILGELGLASRLYFLPEKLSGGEKQRVAIGRALLARPRVVLMDEPLASLDEARRAEILPYIERLRDEAGVPILYVSHSVAEVARLATTVVIMADGKVTAVGPVLETLPLVDASDGGSVLDAMVSRHDTAFELSVLTTVAGELQVPRLNVPQGAPVRAYVRARDVMLSLRPPEEISALNVLPGRVAAVTPVAGAQADVRLDCNGALLVARLTAKSVERLGLAPGRPVYAVIKSVSFERT